MLEHAVLAPPPRGFCAIVDTNVLVTLLVRLPKFKMKGYLILSIHLFTGLQQLTPPQWLQPLDLQKQGIHASLFLVFFSLYSL